MKPFRTFVNNIGSSPSVTLRPEEKENPSTFIMPISLYSHLYWDLKNLTIDYQYRIDEEIIHHTLTTESVAPDLKTRILGDHHYGIKTEDKTENTKTLFSFNLSRPFDPHVPQITTQEHDLWHATNPLSKESVTLCKEPLKPLQQEIGLRMALIERGYALDDPNKVEFEVTLVTSLLNQEYIPQRISSIQGKFLDYSMFVELISYCQPGEIDGELLAFTVTPEFFTYEEEGEEEEDIKI
ncbi:MAG: hypothetical protein J6Z25_01425 [Opitutales bacterium]|nr:hypothetical protein [Opitutales bacterium]